MAMIEPPRSFRVFGRHPSCENADVCGEYAYVSNNGNYPAYQNKSNGMAIRFFGGRWLMDRGGIRNSDVCVAFANQVQNCSHPGNPELVWQVWEAQVQDFVEDPNLVAVDAPEELTFVGRANDRENCVVNGTYTLATVVHGRAAYRHQTEDMLIRFHAEEGRWLISDPRDVGTNVCSVWADATSRGSLHPDATLQWHFWEPEKKTFMNDSCAGVVNAPEIVHVIWRHPQAENARINGTYHLAGIHESRPLYVQPGTSSVIRYSAKNDWWLIDCDGLAKPSLLNRLYQWVLTGDSEAAYDRCSAWAQAHGSEHPGHMDLQWHVWETLGGQHKLDEAVAVTSAPLIVQVSGRDVNRENHDLNGEYQIVADFRGFPAYRKTGTDVYIYFSQHGKWVIDRNGTAGNDTGVVVAYVDGHSSHPCMSHTWHVHEATQGGFVVDPALTVQGLREIQEMPQEVPVAASHAGRGTKRGHGMDNGSTLQMHAPHAKAPRRQDQDRSGLMMGLLGA